MRSKTTVHAMLLLVVGALALAPSAAADHDGLPVPQQVSDAVCGAGALPEAMCPDDHLHVFGLPMDTVLGPVCDATENAPPEVCILRFFSLGQAICMVRAMAPASGAVLVCANGQLAPGCHAGAPAETLTQLLTDADCDGHSNDTEVEQGCDPFDAQSYPTGPMECTAGGGGAETPELGCSDSSDPLVIVADIVSDLDCDGYTNDRELEAGCDPTDPADHPDVPDGCTFLAVPALPEPGEVPDPGELPVDPGALPVDPGELPVDPGALPVDPGELPVDPGELPL